MIGLMQVVQRINSIESRFKQPAVVLPQQNNQQAFSEILDTVEKQSGSKQPQTNIRSDAATSANKKIQSLKSAPQIKTAQSASKNQVAQIVQSTALKYGVNPQLALAVANAESNFNQEAISPVGATGVMQLMPDTARLLKVTDITDLNQNIDGGIRYLKQMLDTFGGDTNKAVAAYNAGPGAVKKYNGIPPYQETQQYVARVNSYMR